MVHPEDFDVESFGSQNNRRNLMASADEWVCQVFTDVSRLHCCTFCRSSGTIYVLHLPESGTFQTACVTGCIPAHVDSSPMACTKTHST